MRLSRVLLIATAASVITRILPFLITGVPFSCDSWGPLGNSLVLLRESPLDLRAGSFDGYNNFWPANSIYAAISSEILGGDLIKVAGIMVPIAGSLSVIAADVVARRLTGSASVAHASALLYALSFSGMMMCGGVIKECYAYYFMLLILTLPFMEDGKVLAVLAAVLSSALVLSHHLTLLLTVMPLWSFAALSSFNILMRGRGSLKTAYLASFLSLLGLAYFHFFARQGFKTTLDEGTVTSFLSYYTLFTALGLMICRGSPQRNSASSSSTFKYLIALLISLILPPALIYVFSLAGPEIVQGAFLAPASFITYSLAYSLLGALAVYGSRKARYSGVANHLIMWLFSLLSFEVFALIAEPPGAFSLAYRTLTFLFIPLSILASISLLGDRKVIAGIVIVLAMNSLLFYSTLTGAEVYTGHFWLYNKRDLRIASWINASSDTAIGGDLRLSYLYEGLFRLKVLQDEGLKAIRGERFNGTLVVYGDMFRYGYITSGGLERVEESAAKHLLSGNSLIYSDGWGEAIWPG